MEVKVTMTFQEFENELLGKTFIKKCGKHFGNDNNYISKHLYESENDYCSYGKTIYYVWKIGGMRGGNCWGEPANNPLEIDDEPELKLFNKIIKEYHPNIGYFTYNDFVKKYVEIEEYEDREYYGNYTEYKIKKLKLIDIYNLLIEEGAIK